MATKDESMRAGERLLERLRSDAAFRSRVEATATYGDFLEVTRSAGLDLSGLKEAEARTLLERQAPPLPELSEEDLGRVAGGAFEAYTKLSGQKQGPASTDYSLVLTW